MNLSLYDAFLDPVIIISEDGVVQHLNPAAKAWLATDGQSEFEGKPLDQFVFFTGTEMFDNAGKLQDWQSTVHERSRFRFPHSNYESGAVVSIQKIPFDNGVLYPIIVRDLIFATASDDGRWQNWQTRDIEQTAVSPTGIANDTAWISQNKLLDEVTLTKSMAKDHVVRYETKVNAFIVEHKLALVGRTIVIAATWVEAELKANNLSPGLNCNLELQGTSDLKAISVRSKITEVNKSENDCVRVKFMFENVGSLTKRAIDDFLIKNTPTF